MTGRLNASLLNKLLWQGLPSITLVALKPTSSNPNSPPPGGVFLGVLYLMTHMTQDEWDSAFAGRDEMDHPINKNGSMLPLDMDPEYEWTRPQFNPCFYPVTTLGLRSMLLPS